MFDDKTLNQVRQGMKKWSEETQKVSNDLRQAKRFSTISNLDVEPAYTPESIKEIFLPGAPVQEIVKWVTDNIKTSYAARV